MWMLTGHSEVDQVLRSPVAQLQYTKRMDAMRPAWRDHAASAYLEGVIAFVDGPPHQKIRKALMPGWTKPERSDEHKTELQSLMRISYAVFCLKKKILM